MKPVKAIPSLHGQTPSLAPFGVFYHTPFPRVNAYGTRRKNIAVLYDFQRQEDGQIWSS